MGIQEPLNTEIPRFKRGDRVQLRSDRSRIGTIVSDAVTQSGLHWYRVHFVHKEYTCEQDLEPYNAGLDPVDLFAAQAFGDQEDFLRTVTFAKLSTPLENTIYALNSSRTDFYPHQYKPLVKLLDSANQRLLVADEVGLGKTIEAGLVLCELRARGGLEQVLIVCPAALTHKWRDEMYYRFDEEFTIYNSFEFRTRVDRYISTGEFGKFRGIISLPSLRQNLELLESLPIPTDLLIVDEAHHCRNPETISNKVVTAVAEAAGTVMLLTATPIQLGNENLYYLFRILDPSEFNDYSTFELRLKANEPVVAAESLLRSKFPSPLQEVASEVAKLATYPSSVFFQNNPLVERVRSGVVTSDPRSRRHLARLQHDLKDLNLLSQVFTRSRKRDVFTSAPKREPVVRRAKMSDAEKRFYDAVTSFVRTARGGDSMSAAFAGITAQRQVASSMIAAKSRFVERALTESIEDSDAPDFFDEEFGDVAPTSSDELLAAAEGLHPSEDTKLRLLLEALGELEAVDARRKVIVFSYFKDTLRYLQGRLDEAGYTCGVIHGDIKTSPNESQDERLKVINRFRDDPECRILLASEVGSEGLDFQFCHVLINYDLPWNPMRVEQRIGRLDRLGQQAKRIVIVNLTLEGTIEDRILERLYLRIGIFKKSIGDLEAILGDIVENLARELLSKELTPEEEEEAILRAEAAIENRRLSLERLESESSRFIGADAFFDEQLERARTGGEFLAPADVRAFINRFLETAHPRTEIHRDRDGGERIRIDPTLDMAIRGLPPSVAKTNLLRHVAVNSGVIHATFEVPRVEALSGLEVISSQHPLTRLAAAHFNTHREQLHPVSGVAVASATVPAGTYLYLLQKVAIHSARARIRLEPFFIRTSDGYVADVESSSQLLGQILRDSRAWQTSELWNPEEVRQAVDDAERAFVARLSAWRTEIEGRNRALVQTRLATLDSAHSARVGRKQELLDRARAANKQERYVRMLEGTVRNLTSEYQRRRAELLSDMQISLSSELIGCGIVEVTA